MFINIFGIPCPTCGITRAFISLINFNFKEAFRFHPLFWIIRMYLYFPNIEPMIFNKNSSTQKIIC
ncbi:MAG: DUF2752 domain-containing protein [Cetobacterium sp.]|uniref:DUF2752 domain-containing protein n=1 Tax=Cetobacterium sp. TaxID=2071632 RepID=UPI003F38EA49